MASANIDSNQKGTWTAYNETTGLVERVRVDPVLNAVLVFGVASDASVPTSVNRAKIDGNSKGTATGYDDTTGSVEAMRCGNDGSLLVKIVS